MSWPAQYRAAPDHGASLIRRVHTAYDWNGSHQYQHYRTRKKIELLFKKLGINESDIIYLKSKGLYRIKKHFDNDNLKFDSKYFVFGDV